MNTKLNFVGKLYILSSYNYKMQEYESAWLIFTLTFQVTECVLFQAACNYTFLSVIGTFYLLETQRETFET